MKPRRWGFSGAGAILLGLVACAAAVLAASGNMDSSWLAVLGAGALLAFHGMAKLQLLDRARRWERVPAKVLERGVQEVWSAGYPRFRPLLVFEARVAGQPVRSSRIAPDPEDHEGEEAEAHAFLQAFAPGAAFEAFVDPRRPGHPVARVDAPAARRRHYRNCVIAGSALMLVALAAGGYLAL